MESKHNLKYWTRQPYIGFGLDAHSMLETPQGAVRFSTPDSLQEFMSGALLKRIPILARAALEETFFLGLRLTRGVDLKTVAARFGVDVEAEFGETIRNLELSGMLEQDSRVVRLTPSGCLLSNEVFERFIERAEVQPDHKGSQQTMGR
jgi:oxygen-independent coproporphyrinogen-3 oxidase